MKKQKERKNGNRDEQKSNLLNLSRTKPRKTTVEKPWYDVSDEETDMASPDHITSIITLRSSDDDTFWDSSKNGPQVASPDYITCIITLRAPAMTMLFAKVPKMADRSLAVTTSPASSPSTPAMTTLFEKVPKMADRWPATLSPSAPAMTTLFEKVPKMVDSWLVASSGCFLCCGHLANTFFIFCILL